MSVVIDLAESTEFRCISEDVTWSFNGSALPLNAAVRSDGTLVLHNALLSNVGYYECKGSYGDSNITFYAEGLLNIFGKLLLIYLLTCTGSKYVWKS